MSSAPFRRLLAAQTVSRWGDTFNSVALVVLVYRLTGSGLGVAVVVALEIAPVLLFGFLAGAVVDRLPRRQVMIGADLGRAGVALALAALHRHLAAVYLAAFALAALSTFFAPAVASALPSIVDRDDLVGANSALWSAAVVSQIVLAPAAGALVSLAGPAPAFLLNAASFAVSALLLTRLTLPPHRGGRLGSRWQEAAAGLRTVAGDRLLGTLALTQVLAALSAGATSALLVVLAADHLRVGPGRFGLLLAAIGVGAGLGPLVAQRLVVDVRQPRWLFGPYLLRGVVDLLLAGVRSFPVAAGALAAYGVGTSTGMVAYNSLLQTTVVDEVRGRVFSLYDVLWQASRLVSLAAGGALADAFGIRVVYVLGGMLLLAAGAVGFARAGSDRGGGAPAPDMGSGGPSAAGR